MNMLSISEAAEILGYTVKGLRKIIDRSKAKVQGARVRGPTIRFFQTTKGASVKFKLEWVEEFIERHTIDPFAHERRASLRNHRQAVHIHATSGLDEQLFDL